MTEQELERYIDKVGLKIDRVKQLFEETMHPLWFEAEGGTSRMDPEKYGALLEMTAVLMSTMVFSGSMTACAGNVELAKSVAEMVFAKARVKTDVLLSGTADGSMTHMIGLKTMRDGKPVPFDFRDHTTRDSGRASSVGG